MNLTLVVAEPPLPPPVWPAVAVGVALLLAAGALAWRRRRAPLNSRPRRLTRIIVAAAAGGGGALVQMSAAAMISAGGDGIGWNPIGISLPLTMAMHFLGYWAFAAMLIGTTDLLLDVFRPQRSLAWLIVGTPLFASFLVAILGATGWIDSFVIPRTAEQAMVAVAALAAALTWWAWLPAAWEPVAEVFE